MAKSLYWNNMFINKRTDKIFISEERPNFFAEKNLGKDMKVKCSSLGDIDINTILKDVSTFYKTHNKLNTGSTTLLEPSHIKKFNDIDSRFVLLFKNGEILGSIISLKIPVRINNAQNFVFGCTTFLNNHTDYRKKGLGIFLIQKSLQLAYDEGILGAYFLNTKRRAKNSIPIKNWYLTLNFKKCSEKKIKCQEINFEIGEGLKTYKVDKTNLDEALKYYLEILKVKKFYMNPEINFWTKWVDSFDTYISKKEGEIVGIFSLNDFNSLVKEDFVLKYGQILFFGSQNISEVFNELVKLVKDKYDILHLQQNGDISRKLLEEVGAIDTKKFDYVNFYNFTGSFNASDIYVPLI